jgi:acyl carrier protein
MNETKEQVMEILEELCASHIDDETMTLVGDLALDSLRMVTLLLMLEDCFEIELDESDMNPFQLLTVEDVINLACKYTAQKEVNHG